MKAMTVLCAATLAAAFGAVESFRRGAQTVTPNCAKKLLDGYKARSPSAGNQERGRFWYVHEAT